MKTTTDRESVVAQVREVLRLHGRLTQDIAALSDEANLGEAGMTSHASVNVMLALEARFGEIPEHMLTRSVFQSTASIAAAMQSLSAR
ncbi:MAG: acyl carrier protein [Hyphomicrobiales bacterium]|nr:MAG: acyl carrier protein [Hyphomicrobiales bacterium]